MLIFGCDLHTRYQQVAILDTETGEIVERRLEHENDEARAFYESLPPGGRVGIEATVPALWFERLLAERGHELWVGDAARIRAMVVRPQKTDVRDAVHLMELLVTNRFPRIWIPSPEERDVRHLLARRRRPPDDPSRRRSGRRPGLCADGRARGTFPPQQATGQLLRAESSRTLQWWPVAPRLDQQAGQLPDALAAGRDRPNRGAVRSGTAPCLSALEVSSHAQCGQGRDRPQAGRAIVPDAAHRS